MLIKVAKHQRGLSLIEVLIALLVLSIGLLGMGALMLTSLQNVHSSAHYSVASAIVLDFEELLWLEVARMAASDLPALTADSNGCISDNAITTLAAAVTTEWNTASVGGTDAWSDAERFTMPGIALAVGNTTVDGVDKDDDGINDVSWKTIPVTLTWDEARFSEDNPGEAYTATITLVCRPTFL